MSLQALAHNAHDAQASAARPAPAMPWRHLGRCDLAVWTPREVACRNGLLGRWATLQDDHAAGEWHLQWSHDCDDLHATVDIALRVGACRFLVALEHADGLLPFHPAADFTALPLVTRCMLLAMHCGTIVQAIEQASGLAVIVDAMRVAPNGMPRAQTSIGFVASHAQSRWRSRGWVEWTDTAGLELLHGLCERWRPAPRLPRAAAWPVRLRLCLGSTVLARRDLHRLGPGDVLLVRQAVAGAGVARRPGTVAAAAFFAGLSRSLWTVELEYSHMVMQHHQPHHQIDGEDDGHAEAGDPISGLDTLQLTLRFWLADREITVDALSRLQPGHVVGLGQPVAGAAVRVFTGSQCVGLGVLVVIGDQLGVQLTQIAGHAD